MTPQEEIKTLTDYLEKLDAAAEATRQRLEQLREAERPWPSVRDVLEVVRSRYFYAEKIRVVGCYQDCGGDVYAALLVTRAATHSTVPSIMGKYSEHPAGWRNSWTPAHEMRQN